MRWPFAREEAVAGELELEGATRAFFGPLADVRPSGEARARALMAAALAPKPAPVAPRRSVALASVAAVVAPLLVAGAAGAAGGGGAIGVPANVVSSIRHVDSRAVSPWQIGQVLPEMAADTAQQPAASGGAAGSNEEPRRSCGTQVDCAGDVETPVANGARNGLTGKAPPAGGGNGASAATTAATGVAISGKVHTNGDGCDDAVSPGTPGGPQACEMGNSASHRQNGLHQEAEPPVQSQAAPPAMEPAPQTSEQPGNSAFGQSQGNGNGNGAANGNGGAASGSGQGQGHGAANGSNAGNGGADGGAHGSQQGQEPRPNGGGNGQGQGRGQAGR